MTPKLLRPMSDFDPSEPAMCTTVVMTAVPWLPAFEWEFKRCAKEHAPGIIDFEGLLLDGWMIPDEQLPS